MNQVTGTTDPLGRSETYAYFNNGLLQTEVWKSSGGTAVNTLTYSYDAANNMTTASDSSGTVTITYDAPTSRYSVGSRDVTTKRKCTGARR